MMQIHRPGVPHLLGFYSGIGKKLLCLMASDIRQDPAVPVLLKKTTAPAFPAKAGGDPNL
ncbi:MAG: hypothetical protein ACOX17_08760 [Christensenellales bacterium]|jgi:hypothetical protein